MLKITKTQMIKLSNKLTDAGLTFSKSLIAAGLAFAISAIGGAILWSTKEAPVQRPPMVCAFMDEKILSTHCENDEVICNVNKADEQMSCTVKSGKDKIETNKYAVLICNMMPDFHCEKREVSCQGNKDSNSLQCAFKKE